MTKFVDVKFQAMTKEVHVSLSPLSRIAYLCAQWTGLGLQSGIEGFYMAVRTDVGDYHTPKVYMSPLAKMFWSDFLKLDPEYVALQLEAWTTTGLGLSKQSTLL
jgi:hypothetical protein